MDCDECIHKNVCKYSAEFSQIEAKTPKTPAPFITEVTCREFLNKKPHGSNSYYEQQIQRTLTPDKPVSHWTVTCNPNLKSMF